MLHLGKKWQEKWDGSWKDGEGVAIKGMGFDIDSRLFRQSESRCGGEEIIQDARASQKTR